jgi:hypothetical protein
MNRQSTQTEDNLLKNIDSIRTFGHQATIIHYGSPLSIMVHHCPFAATESNAWPMIDKKETFVSRLIHLCQDTEPNTFFPTF